MELLIYGGLLLILSGVALLVFCSDEINDLWLGDDLDQEIDFPAARDAWERGEVIQRLVIDPYATDAPLEWVDVTFPDWDERAIYRIKP